MKVGNLVKPSSEWVGHRFYNEEDVGVGIVIKRIECMYGPPQCNIMWTGTHTCDSWEYDYELEVISESR